MSTATLPLPSTGHERPRWWEWLGFTALLLALVGFGVLTEIRSAYLTRPMTDVQVYFRAAWAVRSGHDIYTVTDANGWHYHYPPLLAILLVPLADAPPDADRSGLLPFAALTAVWYVLSILWLAWAVHLLASALEATSPDPSVRNLPAGSRRWWALRLLPIYICLVTVGHTLNRGQVNLLVLVLLCGLAAAVVRGRSWQAGFWLAGAICVKLIPAFLLLLPLWRRDSRCLAGCALGLVIGFVVIPAAVFGPEGARACYAEWTDVLLRPGLGQGEDQSRAKELIEITATDSQSFQAMIHNTLYPDPDTRPGEPDPWVRRVHWLLGGCLTLLTLLAAGRRVRGSGRAAVVFLGALVLQMTLLSPVCHLHYFCLAIPLVMVLTASAWERRGFPVVGWPLTLLFAMNLVGNVIPHIPECQMLRDSGIAAWVTLLIWLAGVVWMWRGDESVRSVCAGKVSLAA